MNVAYVNGYWPNQLAEIKKHNIQKWFDRFDPLFECVKKGDRIFVYNEAILADSTREYLDIMRAARIYGVTVEMLNECFNANGYYPGFVDATEEESYHSEGAEEG